MDSVSRIYNRFLYMRELIYDVLVKRADGSRKTKGELIESILTKNALYEMFIADNKLGGEYSEYLTSLRVDVDFGKKP